MEEQRAHVPTVGEESVVPVVVVEEGQEEEVCTPVEASNERAFQET